MVNITLKNGAEITVYGNGDGEAKRVDLDFSKMSFKHRLNWAILVLRGWAVCAFSNEKKPDQLKEGVGYV